MGQVTLISSMVVAIVLLIHFRQFMAGVLYQGRFTWKFCENSVQIIYYVSHNKFVVPEFMREYLRLLKTKITIFNLLIWLGLCWEMGMHKAIYHCVDSALKIGLDICHFSFYIDNEFDSLLSEAAFPFYLILLKVCLWYSSTKCKNQTVSDLTYSITP